MNNSFYKIFRGDMVVWIIFGLLVIVSVVEMFSASSSLISNQGSISGPILRHIMFFVIGFVLMSVAMMVPFKYIRALGYAGLVVSWILLLYTLFYGVEQAGAARFLRIGGIQFQPSELAKISVLIVIADFVHRYESLEPKSLCFTLYALAVAATCGLIFPENFSTAALLFMVCMVMMFVGSVHFKYLAVTTGIIIGLVVLIVSISALIPQNVYDTSNSGFVKFFERSHTWVARIDNFAGGEADKYEIDDSNYQVAHAQIAVARGGVMGLFPGNSIQRNYLPEAFSDFIFAIIIEEMGLVGAVFIIVLYMSLMFRAGMLARKSTSLFMGILVIGVTIMVVMQAFIHMGVSVQLGPVTGQPLPLISRGGTSIVITCIYFGLIQNVAYQISLQGKKEEVGDENDDFENDPEVSMQEDEEVIIEEVR